MNGPTKTFAEALMESRKGLSEGVYFMRTKKRAVKTAKTPEWLCGFWRRDELRSPSYAQWLFYRGPLEVRDGMIARPEITLYSDED